MTALVAIDDLTPTSGRAACVHRGFALRANEQQGVTLDKRGEHMGVEREKTRVVM